ncbi:hypothetical protein ACROYT_G042326 [Oculina patagonica]
MCFYFEVINSWNTSHRSGYVNEKSKAKAKIASRGPIENLDMMQKCSPIQHVLYLKTHKTASSTLANIFYRYGDSRDLSFVLGKGTFIGWPERFQLSHTLPFDGTRPNFLCTHTRFNKRPMNFLFPKETSKYITIIRDPVDQFESVFNYVGFGKVHGFGQDPTESLKAFLKKGIEFKDMFKTPASCLARNPMSFDLGLDYRFYQNVTAIKEYISFLEKEFDLVLISDYFDESVVLMKRLLCWKFDDILHIKTNKRIDKERADGLSDDVEENIKRWNKADTLLYHHFNQTFWRKIQMEGKGFYDDLATFRRKKEEIKRLCFTNETSNQLVYPKKYVKVFNLKQNLSGETKVKCERMARFENLYLAYLREKRESKLRGIFRAEPEEDEQEKLSWDLANELRYDPV